MQQKMRVVENKMSRWAIVVTIENRIKNDKPIGYSNYLGPN